MNNIKTIDSEYIRSNRSIDTILVSKGNSCKTLWIYNFEGVHYRVFENLLDIFGFLNNVTEPKYDFENEIELDNFLLNYRIIL